MLVDSNRFGNRRRNECSAQDDDFGSRMVLGRFDGFSCRNDVDTSVDEIRTASAWRLDFFGKTTATIGFNGIVRISVTINVHGFDRMLTKRLDRNLIRRRVS